MAEERLLWEDLTEVDVAVSSGRTITETDVVSFCGLSGDFNWFHVDAVAAKESVFGQRVALFGSVGSRTPSTAEVPHLAQAAGEREQDEGAQDDPVHQSHRLAITQLDWLPRDARVARENYCARPMIGKDCRATESGYLRP